MPVKCNDNYICENDNVTYEDIETPDHCLSIGDKMCTTCESASLTRSSNSEMFNRSPVQSIFGEGDYGPDADERFWNILHEKCGMNRPSTSSQQSLSPNFFIALPNYSNFNANVAKILTRTRNYAKEGLIKDANTSMFIETIQKVVTSLKDINFEKYSDPKEFIKSLFRDILRSEQCSSQMIHDPIVIPASVEVFVNELAETPKTKFILVARLLYKRPEACLEAVIEKCHSIMSKRPLSAFNAAFPIKKTLRRTIRSKSRSKSRSKYRSKSRSKSRTK